MKRFVVTLLVLLFTQYLVGQQKIDVGGTVIDSMQVPLVSATVVLISQADSSLVQFGLTNGQGKFKLRSISAGTYSLQVTYLGYEQNVRTIITKNEDIDLGEIIMKRALNALEEVVVKGEHAPIMVRKDTIEYNAAAFKTQPNEVVEDLLKRLPGIEVEDDGNIKAQGEDVEKVLVDGKEFFGNDPKIATRNLPADAVDKVQVYDRKSDMAEFTGIDDGDREKTINLELRDDRKKGYFGTAGAGYGSDERYSARMSLSRFNKGLQVSVIGLMNNINEQGFSFDEYLNFMGGFGGLMSGGGRMRVGGDVPINSGLSNGFVDTGAGGINLNYDFSEKADISINYFVNDIANTTERKGTTENFLEGGSYFTNERSLQESANTSHRFNTRFNLELDSTQNIRVESSFSLSEGMLDTESNSDLVNADKVTELNSARLFASQSNSDDISGELTYRKRFRGRKSRNLTLNASLNSTSRDIDGDNAAENIFDTGTPSEVVETLLQRSVQNDDQASYSVRTSFVEPLKLGKFLEFSYRRQNYDNDWLREVYDVEGLNEILNNGLSDLYNRNFTYDRYGVGFHLNTEKASVTIEGNYQASRLFGDIISDGVTIEKRSKSFLPRFSWRQELGTSHGLRFTYQTSVREPSLEQLQPTVDNTDPVNLYIGNPDLKTEYRHRMQLRYFKYDQFTFTTFFAYLATTITEDKITNERTIDNRFRQITRPVNVDNDLGINSTVSFNTPVRPLGIKIDIRNNFNFQNSILFINGVENDLDRFSGSFEGRVENRNKDLVDISVGGRWGYNINKYSVNAENNQNYFDQNYFGEWTVTPGSTFMFRTSMNYTIYSEQDFSDRIDVPIWNASLSYYFLKNKKGELKVSAFDILNRNIGISRNSNLNYISNEEILSLGRYVLLSFNYAIAGFKKDEGRDVKIRR